MTKAFVYTGGDESRESQQAAIRAFCQLRGFQSIREFEDKPEHTAYLPALSDLVAVAGEGTAQTVVVRSILSLSKDPVVVEVLLRELYAAGLRVFEATTETELKPAMTDTGFFVHRVFTALEDWRNAKKQLPHRERKKHKPNMTNRKLTPQDRETLELVVRLREIDKLTFDAISVRFTKEKRNGVSFWSRNRAQSLYGIAKKKLAGEVLRPALPKKPAEVDGLAC